MTYERTESGFALMAVVPTILILLVFLAAMLRLTNAGMHFSAMHGARQRAFYVADGGLQAAMTRLYADRQTASTSASYTASGAASIGVDPYAYSVVQDPMYPSDPTRKQISSTASAAGVTSTVVSQVQVYPFQPPPTGGNGNPTCDWAIFADTGAAELVNGAAVATDLLNGNVHSNGDLHLTALTGAGIHGSGRFEAANQVVAYGAVGGILSTLSATLFRGGSWSASGALADIHVLGAPVNGIHFSNGAPSYHGVQQPVPSVPFPLPDWKALEQASGVVVVDADHLPFGSWDSRSGTWVVEGRQVLPNDATLKYLVRGNARFQTLTLARNTRASIAAEGAIEIGEVASLQMNAGGIVAVGLNSGQTLRLIGRQNVFIGRSLSDPTDVALSDDSRPGLNLVASAAMSEDLAAYSQTGDVWVKSSTVSALVATRLNLVASRNSTYAVTAAPASTPTGYCQPLGWS